MEDAIKLFQDGKVSAYKVIATQLRMLLCDKREGKQNALVPRLFQNFRLHPLLVSLTRERYEKYKRKFGHSSKDDILFHFHGMLQPNSKGGAKITKLFDESREPIELEEWLDQNLLNPEITIRELIRSVADKEAVHSDPDYNETLKSMKSFTLNREEIHIKYIVAIGEYVLKLIKPKLKLNYDNSAL
jgi:hypothetical protein